MYAVIAIQWHQYIVQEGVEITVDRIQDTEEWSSVSFDTVLCSFDKSGKTVSVGKPYVKWAKVTAKVVANQKGKKMRVLKFQWKKRYQRIKWFRPHQTVLSIEKIAA